MNANSTSRQKTWITTVGCFAVLLLSLPTVLPADTAAKPSRPAIYDETAVGAKQIEAALAQAKKDNKRVLLQFGANWCGW